MVRWTDPSNKRLRKPLEYVSECERWFSSVGLSGSKHCINRNICKEVAWQQLWRGCKIVAMHKPYLAELGFAMILLRQLIEVIIFIWIEWLFWFACSNLPVRSSIFAASFFWVQSTTNVPNAPSRNHWIPAIGFPFWPTEFNSSCPFSIGLVGNVTYQKFAVDMHDLCLQLSFDNFVWLFPDHQSIVSSRLDLYTAG